MDIKTSFINQSNKNYRNYIIDIATQQTKEQIRKLINNTKQKINIINVEMLRSNGENYIIYIRYGNQWLKEYTEDLLLWNEDKETEELNPITTFHFIIQEYRKISQLKIDRDLNRLKKQIEA